MTYTLHDPIKELSVTKSLQLLRDGFKSDLATYAYADERMTELLMELVSDFVEVNIPVVDEYNRTELALMLMETLDIIAR
jgi:RNase H-fold protein (predicted Holliday junction resolvase)